MAWYSVNINGTEVMTIQKPHLENDGFWAVDGHSTYLLIPSGSIEKLIGRPLKWDDDPVELE